MDQDKNIYGAEVAAMLRAKGYCGKYLLELDAACCKARPCPVHPEKLEITHGTFTAELRVDPKDDNMYRVTLRCRETPNRESVPWLTQVLSCKEADELYMLLGMLPRGAKIPSVRKDVIGKRCDECTRAATHAEHWHSVAPIATRVRAWCDAHVPMSGHYEWCRPNDPNDPCQKLLAELNAKAQ